MNTDKGTGNEIPVNPEQQNAREPLPEHKDAPGAWDGPFTAGKCQVHDDTLGTYDGAAVFDATGQPFALVADDDCVGGNPGARARATSIAESLNRDQHLFERTMAEVADESGDPFPWSIRRPSELDRARGQPEFVVVLTGDCWHDVERNLADAREKGGFTAPTLPGEGIPIPTPEQLVDQWWARLCKQSVADTPAGQVTMISRNELCEAMEDAALSTIDRPDLLNDVTRFLLHPGCQVAHGSLDFDLQVTDVSVVDHMVVCLVTSTLGEGMWRFPFGELVPAGPVNDAVRHVVKALMRATIDDMIAQLVQSGTLKTVDPDAVEEALAAGWDRGHRADGPPTGEVHHLQAHPEYVMEPGSVHAEVAETRPSEPPLDGV